MLFENVNLIGGFMFNIPQVIQNRGLRLQDSFELNIFQKGRRRLNMTRTKYLIISAEHLELDFKNNIFYLPSLKNEKFRVEISLVNFEDEESEGRYIIKSLDDSFFKLNGNSCQVAFLERNDMLDIGYNKFLFRQFINEENQSSPAIPKQVIQSQLPILIEGETGTGKTRLAKIIHKESSVTGNFVHINLSSFSPQLIESEIFGHVKGAFTGATNDRKGAILEANKGTLYLDEIDSLSLDLQTKLLLFLESQEFRPVGLDRTIQSQVRIICSSGQDLKKLVAHGKMRSDFYFRINNGYKVVMPALNKKPQLIEKVCHAFSEETNVFISNELIEFYKKFRWAGNIRELRAHLMKKVVLADGKRLMIDDVDLELLNWNEQHLPVENLTMTLEELKLNHTYSVYYQYNQNLKLTSEVLGVCPNTVRAILSKKIA